MIIFNENEKNHILLGLAVTFAGHLPGSLHYRELSKPLRARKGRIDSFPIATAGFKAISSKVFIPPINVNTWFCNLCQLGCNEDRKI